jgi:predicted transcriptional regulator
MSRTLTIRLPEDLADWLDEAAARSGVARGQIVRDQLEKARATAARQGFMQLAGSVRGPADLSQRKGFSRR